MRTGQFLINRIPLSIGYNRKNVKKKIWHCYKSSVQSLSHFGAAILVSLTHLPSDISIYPSIQCLFSSFLPSILPLSHSRCVWAPSYVCMYTSPFLAPPHLPVYISIHVHLLCTLPPVPKQGPMAIHLCPTVSFQNARIPTPDNYLHHQSLRVALVVKAYKPKTQQLWPSCLLFRHVTPRII